MAGKRKSTIWSRPDGKAEYLTIPRDIVNDMKYPFKDWKNVLVIIDVEHDRIVVEKDESEDDSEVES